MKVLLYFRTYYAIHTQWWYVRHRVFSLPFSSTCTHKLLWNGLSPFLLSGGRWECHHGEFVPYCTVYVAPVQ